jgi:hypothetical protein
MKPSSAIKITLLILSLMVLALPATAQVSRLNFASQTTSGQCVPGSQCPVLAIPGSTVTVCTYSLAGCAATATTYSDATGTTPCPTFAQVTPGCVSTVDNNGNGGIWVTSGNYNIYFTPPGGTQQGPFPFTAGGGGGGGGLCPQGPITSVQVSNGAGCVGSSNLTYTGQTLTSLGASGGPAFIASGGTFQSQANAYNGFNSNTDGIAVPAYQVSQNGAALAGGYLVFTPLTYNPYDQAGTCLDQFGNIVRQPLQLPGTSFGTFASVLWVGESPSLPAAPTAGCPTPGGPPLPVNPSGALNGLNTNSYFFARGGLATDDPAYNSIQSLLGGIYTKLGATIDQGSYYLGHTLGTINSPSGTYGGLGYISGSIYQYFNDTDHMWHPVDFSASGGTGCTVGAPNLSILFSNGSSGCTGSANGELDLNGNLSLAGTGSVIAINGATGGINITANGAYNTVQSIGGAAFNLSNPANAGLTVVGATSQTKNLAEFYTHTPTLVAAVSASGGGIFASMKVAALAGGGGQCVQVDNTGLMSGTGMTCGSGGGGSPGAPTTSVQTNQSGVFTGSSALTWDNTNDQLHVTNGGPEFNSAIVIDSTIAAKASYLQFYGAGTQYWAIGRNDSTNPIPNSFQIYDNTSSSAIISIGPGSSQNINLLPTSHTVSIGGLAATAGLAIAGGFGQADQGFLATNAVCVSYSCFQTQTGGFAGRSLNLSNYASMSSATISPTAGDSWAGNPGVFYYNSTGSPTWYFLHGTGASTAADAVVHGDSFVGTNISVSFNASGAFSSAATGTNLTFENNDGCFSVQGNGIIQGGCSTSGLNLTAATATNSIQTTGGVKGILGVISDQAIYLKSLSSTPNNPASGYGGLSYTGTNAVYRYWNANTLAWANVDLSTTGGGVTSINGLTGALGTASDFALHSVSVGCGGPGSIIGVVQSCNTGGAITFQNQNSNFSVDGNGDISMAGNFAILGNCNSGPCGAWSTWTPTVTGFTGASGVARYTRWGKIVAFEFAWTGTTTGATPTFTVPVTGNSFANTPVTCSLNVAGTQAAIGYWASTTTINIGTYNGVAYAPSVFAQVLCSGAYESN